MLATDVIAFCTVCEAAGLPCDEEGVPEGWFWFELMDGTDLRLCSWRCLGRYATDRADEADRCPD